MSYQNFNSKFNRFEISKIRIPPSLEEPEYFLKEKYGEDKLILMVQDPRCIYAYWELTDEFYEKNNLKDKKLFLRYIDKSNHNCSRDIDLTEGCNNYFIGLEYADSIYQVYIGAYPINKPKEKKLLMFSNIVRTQRDYSSVDNKKISEFYNRLRNVEEADIEKDTASIIENERTSKIVEMKDAIEEIDSYLENINGQAMFVKPADVLNKNIKIKIEYKEVNTIKTIDAIAEMQDEKGENKDESRIFNACTTPSPAVCKTSGI